jgi:hypothetical protein
MFATLIAAVRGHASPSSPQYLTRTFEPNENPNGDGIFGFKEKYPALNVNYLLHSTVSEEEYR